MSDTDVTVTKQQLTDIEAIEKALIVGDLAPLTPTQRVLHYHRVCESIGLNPMTKPFEYIPLNGKLVLYVKRDATDQLRKIHGVSIGQLQRSFEHECYIVTAPAATPDGRTDASIGAVGMVYPKEIKNRKGDWVNHPKAGQPLEGEDRANALMKAESKAKRRVTLSIVGLGMMDESEVADISALERGEVGEAPVVQMPARRGEAQQIAATDPPVAVLLTEAQIGVIKEQCKAAGIGQKSLLNFLNWDLPTKAADVETALKECPAATLPALLEWIASRPAEPGANG